ncbi:TIGR01440 family protein [Pseudalkalibacillus hwajinpoensis]
MTQHTSEALQDLQIDARLTERHLLVIGMSSSEVIGKRIGTSGTTTAAEAIFESVRSFQRKTGVQLAFQCCEHLNRALVVERETAYAKRYDIVAAVPTAKAGGSMATYAFSQMSDPVLVEFISADAGIDIGDTFIGMHIRHVAVPVRSMHKSIGHAHLTMARSRPKLIGGERASYPGRNEHCF